MVGRDSEWPHSKFKLCRWKGEFDERTSSQAHSANE